MSPAVHYMTTRWSVRHGLIYGKPDFPIFPAVTSRNVCRAAVKMFLYPLERLLNLLLIHAFLLGQLSCG